MLTGRGACDHPAATQARSQASTLPRRGRFPYALESSPRLYPPSSGEDRSEISEDPSEISEGLSEISEGLSEISEALSEISEGPSVK